MDDAESDSERIGRSYLRVFNDRNLDILDELLHPDFVSHLRVGELRGVEPFRQMMRGFYDAFPDARWFVDEWVFTENRVVLRYHCEGTQVAAFLGIPATQKRVRVEGLELLHLKDRQIVEVWNYSDLMGLAAQLQAPDPLAMEA